MFRPSSGMDVEHRSRPRVPDRRLTLAITDENVEGPQFIAALRLGDLRCCEGGLEARHIGLLQLVLDKPACRLPVPAAPPVADLCGVRG